MRNAPSWGHKRTCNAGGQHQAGGGIALVARWSRDHGRDCRIAAHQPAIDQSLVPAPWDQSSGRAGALLGEVVGKDEALAAPPYARRFAGDLLARLGRLQECSAMG